MLRHGMTWMRAQKVPATKTIQENLFLIGMTFLRRAGERGLYAVLEDDGNHEK